MEEKIKFISEGFEIEGLLNKAISEKGIVITHPHPLYGGDMYNYVVEAIAHAYQKKLYTTLRFNFRGVGRSQGNYDNGMGEQNDVIAAVSYLADAGIKQIDLAGYSFGAWVISRIDCEKIPVNKMIMVSPPVGFMDFEPVSPIPCLRLVITGDEDEIAPVPLIQKILPIWNPDARFEIIPNTDHFYSGRLKTLESVLCSPEL